MAASVSIHEAKTHFSKLVRRAQEGEEIVVRRGKEPVARIAPLRKSEGVRGFGAMKGQIRIGPGFDAVDAEVERAFEESETFPPER